MSSIVTVHLYTPDHRQEWDAFVENSNNGTMFQMQRFLDYHEQGKWNFMHLMFREGNKLVGVLPGGINANADYWSPIGASYGGFVVADTSFARCLAIVDAGLAFLKAQGIRHAYIIPPPLIYSNQYSQHAEYAQLYRKADFELHYISHAIHLQGDVDFLNRFDATARKTIRKILREGKVEIRESTDYETFHHILTENKKRHNVRPTHTLHDLRRLQELVPDKLRLNMVYYDGKPIAGSLLFLANPKVVLCFYNMLLYEYEHLKPIYLVMYETCRWAVENGYEWVDIGVSQDTSAADPMTPSLGLIEFKERFNSRGILRSTFHHTLL